MLGASWSSSTMSDEKTSKVADDTTSAVAKSEEEPRKWATTRTELWAFYVYYIVSIIRPPPSRS